MALITEWCKRGECERCDNPKCTCRQAAHPKGGHNGAE